MSATFRKWLDEFTEHTGEVPDTIVLGWDNGWGDDYRKNEWPAWDGWGQLRPLSELPAVLLDREFDDGWGGNESPNLCAWSRSWVIFSDNYDGSESPQWVPRNPIAHEPTRPGGG